MAGRCLQHIHFTHVICTIFNKLLSCCNNARLFRQYFSAILLLPLANNAFSLIRTWIFFTVLNLVTANRTRCVALEMWNGRSVVRPECKEQSYIFHSFSLMRYRQSQCFFSAFFFLFVGWSVTPGLHIFSGGLAYGRWM